jgi:hypothetical protein
MELVFIDADRPGHLKIGAWEASGDTVSIAYLGTFPISTQHLGTHADGPLSLAKLLLSQFPE